MPAVLLGLAAGLVLAEVVLRIYFAVAPAPPNAIYVRDRDAGYRLRPDPPEVFLRDPDNYTNSLGFRDREHSTAKPPATYRILGIGDSFVYANVRRLSDHFLKVAEAEASRLGPDSTTVEMVLMGIGGYSPENEVGVLHSLGLPLSPDMVILAFFVGNDVTGIRMRGKILGGQWYPASSPYGWLNLLRKSDLFLLAEKTLLPPFRGFFLRILLRGRAGTEGAPAAPPPEAGGAVATAPASAVPSDWYLHAILKDLPIFSAAPDTELERAWSEAEAYLEEFDRLCDRAGAPWILLAIPAHIQVDPALQQAFFRRFSESPAHWDLDAPQRRLRTFASARGIPLVDPLEAMRAATRPDSSLYMPGDGHWNIRGNHLAGRILAERIVELRGERQD